MAGAALIWDLVARDGASPTFNRVAASADRAAVATGRASKEMETSAGVMAGFSKKVMAGFAGFAVADLLGHAVSSAINFQKQMTLIQTQAGATAGQVDKMSSAILSMSGEVATAPEQLATSMYHAFSATHNYAESLKVTRIAAEGAKVGNADLEDTTNALTSAVVSGIKGVNNMQQAMGALNAIVGAGDMKLSDLNDALGTGLLVQAKSFGITIDQVGGALATFGDNNIRGADAATKLRQAFQDLAKPAATSAPFLAQIGLNAQKLQDALTGPGHLTAALGLLRTHMLAAGIEGSKMGAFLENAFTKRAGAGLAVLIQQFGRYQAKTKDVQDGAKGFGAAWEATTHTAAIALQRIGAEFQSVGIAVGEKLLPAVTAAAAWLGKNIPAAMRTLGSILSPLIHTIGDGLVTAWHMALDVLKPVGAALAGLGHFLANNSQAVKAFGVTAIGLWAAIKGYTIISAAIGALTRFVAGLRMTVLAEKEMETQSYATGIGIRRSFMNIGSASLSAGGALKAGLGGAVIGSTLGALTANSSTATKAVSLLGSTAAGAAVGAFGGPWGAAIGGAAGLVSGLAAQIFGATKDTNQFNDSLDNMTTAVEQANGAITKQTELTVAQALETSGAATTMRELGINVHGAVMAIMKGGTAQDNFNEKLFALKPNAQVSADAISKMSTSIGDVSGKYGIAIINARDLNTDVNGTGKAAAGAKGPLDGLTTTYNRQAIAALNAKNATENLAKELKNLDGGAISAAQAEIGFRTSLQSFTQSMNQNGDALKGNSAAALANRDAALSAMQAAEQHAQALQQQGKGADVVKAALDGDIRSLIGTTSAGSKARQQLMDLLGTMHLMPKQIDTEIKSNVGPIITLFDQARQALEKLQGNHIVSITYETKNGPVGANARGGSVPDGLSVVGEEGPELVVKRGNRVDVMSNPASRKFVDSTGMSVPGFAAGTGVDIGAIKSRIHAMNKARYDWGGVGPDAIDCSGFVGDVVQWVKGGSGYSRIFTTATEGSVLPGYGFQPGPGKGEGNLIVGWNSHHTTGRLAGLNFEAYGDENVALDRQVRVGPTAFDPRKFPNVMHLAVGGSNKEGPPGGDPHTGGGNNKGPTKKEQRQAANGRALRQARYGFESSQHPHKILKRGGHFYFGGQSYNTRAQAVEAQREAQVTAAQDKARSQRQAHREALKSLRGGIGAFIGALDGSVKDERKAFKGLLPDIRKLGGDDKFITKIEAQNERLDKAMNRRNKIEKALAKTKAALSKTLQARSQLVSSVRGSLGFDLTSAGTNATNSGVSAGAMLAQEKQQLGLINKWANGITKLHKMGLSGSMLAQFAEAGTASWPQVNALLHASPKVFREIMRDQRRINARAKDIATGVGKERYGDRIHDEKQRIAREKRREKRAEKRVEKLAKKIGEEIAKEFKGLKIEVKIDKKHQARVVRDGEKQMQRERQHTK